MDKINLASLLNIWITKKDKKEKFASSRCHMYNLYNLLEDLKNQS